MSRKSNRRTTLSSVDIENFLNAVSTDDPVKSSSRRCTMSTRESYSGGDIILQSPNAFKIPVNDKFLTGRENVDPNTLKQQNVSTEENLLTLFTAIECDDEKKRMIQHVQPGSTPNSFSEEEKLIRQFCKLRVGKTHYDESVLNLAQEVLEKTSYPLVPTRIIHPAQYIYPCTSIEGKRALLVSLSPMLIASDKQRQEDTLECELKTRCKAIKMKNRHGYEYFDRVTGLSVPPEEFERRYRIFLGREISRENPLLRQVSEIVEDELTTQATLPCFPKDLIADDTCFEELSEGALFESSSNNSNSLKRNGSNGRGGNKSRRVTLSPKTAREMLLASVRDNDIEVSMSVTASDYDREPLDPVGTLPLDMMSNSPTTPHVEKTSTGSDQPVNTPHKLQENADNPVAGCSASCVDGYLLTVFNSEQVTADDRGSQSSSIIDGVTMWTSASVESIQITLSNQCEQPCSTTDIELIDTTANFLESALQASAPMLPEWTIATEHIPVETTQLKIQAVPLTLCNEQSSDANTNSMRIAAGLIETTRIDPTLQSTSLKTETPPLPSVESKLNNLNPPTLIHNNEHLGVLLDFDGLEPDHTSTLTNAFKVRHSYVITPNLSITPDNKHGAITVQPQIIDVFDRPKQKHSQLQLFPSSSSIGGDPSTDAAIFFSSLNPPMSNCLQIPCNSSAHQTHRSLSSSAPASSVEFSDTVYIPDNFSPVNEVIANQEGTVVITNIENINGFRDLDDTDETAVTVTTAAHSDEPNVNKATSVILLEQPAPSLLSQQQARMVVERLASSRLHIRLDIARWKFQWEVVSYLAALTAARRQNNGCNIKEAISQI